MSVLIPCRVFVYCFSFNQSSICQSGSERHQAGFKHRDVVLSLLAGLGIPVPREILETPAIFSPSFLQRPGGAQEHVVLQLVLEALHSYRAALLQGLAAARPQSSWSSSNSEGQDAAQGCRNRGIRRTGTALSATESRFLCCFKACINNSIKPLAHTCFAHIPSPVLFSLHNPVYYKLKRTQLCKKQLVPFTAMTTLVTIFTVI